MAALLRRQRSDRSRGERTPQCRAIVAPHLVAVLTATTALNAQQQFATASPRPPLTVATAAQAVTAGLAVGDVDADGNLDLVVSDATSTYAIRGLGGGAFAVDPFAAAATGQRVAIAQLDGTTAEEWLLLPRSPSAPKPLMMIRRTPTGLLASIPLPASLGSVVADAATSDFDRDGDLDILASLPAGAATPLVLLRNDGTGTFTVDTAPLPTVPAGMSLRTVDCDGDGDDDVLALTPSGGATLLVFANGRLFAASGLLPTMPTGYRDCCTGDFDGNGLEDIVLCNGNGEIDVIWCQPGGNVLAHGIATLTNTSRLLTADTDGDGDLDVVADRSGSSIAGLRNDGGRSFAAQVVLPLPFSVMATGDLDGDGLHEILFTSTQFPSRIATTRATDGGVVDAAYLLALGLSASETATSPVIPGDFNGDGRTDLLLMNPTRLLTSRGDGSYSISSPTIPTLGIPQFAADLDGDGDDDLVCTGLWQAILNNGGSFAATNLGPIEQCTTGDVDGDGDIDLVGINTNQVFVRPNVGPGAYAGPTNLVPGTLGRSTLELADLDGDGDLDIATGLNGTTSFRMVLLANDGLGNFAPSPRLTVNRDGLGSLASADLDGDGDIDLAGSDGTGLRLLENTGSGTFLDVTSLPAAPAGQFTRISIGDVDGDGDADIWLDQERQLLLNQGNMIFAAAPSRLVPVAFGSPRITTLLDVDDDGDLDIVPNPNGSLHSLLPWRNNHRRLHSLAVPRIGASAQFEIGSSPAAPATGIAAIAWSTSQLARPLQLPVVAGQLELDPALAILAAAVPLPPTGLSTTAISIPNVEALVGISVIAQAVIVPTTGAPGFTNAIREVVMR